MRGVAGEGAPARVADVREVGRAACFPERLAGLLDARRLPCALLRRRADYREVGEEHLEARVVDGLGGELLGDALELIEVSEADVERAAGFLDAVVGVDGVADAPCALGAVER